MYRIILDSRDRISTSPSSSDFELILNNSVRVKKLKVEYIWIPGSFYNITSSNNKIHINEAIGGAKTATLTPGSYTASTLAIEMQTQMNTVSAGYTVTYNTNQYTFTWSNAASFQFTTASDSPWYEIGLANATTASGTSLTSSFPISLDRPLNLFISIQGLDKTVITGASQFSACICVPIDAARSQDSLKEPEDEYIKVPTGTVILQRLKVRLLDQTGSPFNLQSGDWVLSLFVVDQGE